MRNRFLSLRNERGMTLIEIMIVIAIIAGLMAVLGSSAVKFFTKAKVKQSVIRMRNLGTALEHYNMDCGSYPETDIGLEALTDDPGTDVCRNWGPDKYVKKEELTDMFGHKYQYELVDGKPIVTFLGMNGKEGGKEFDRDVRIGDEE